MCGRVCVCLCVCVCADWLGICADALKGKMKGSPNLLCSSDVFQKKMMYLFLALPLGARRRDCECIREVLGGFEILSEQKKKPNFFFFSLPFACVQLELRKACGRLAARKPGESMLHGQAK